MTTRSRFRIAPRPDRARRLTARGFAWRGATVAAPLLAALLIAPPVPIDSAAPTEAVPELAAFETPSVASPAARTMAPARVDFDKIAEILAKRYRVSSRATVDLVRTAYLEANRNGLDPLLILAVMAIESRFNPIAESDGGAVGLMQIVPRFHEDKLASRDGSVLDPRINIEVGTQLLREYIRRAGNEVAGLQLYNGSPDDPASAYANKVIGERDRLRQAIKRADGERV